MRKSNSAKGIGWWAIIISVGLSLASGLLLALALPPRSLSLLGWLAFLPLLAALRLTRSFFVGVLLGVLATLTAARILVGHITELPQFGNCLAAFGTLAIVLGGIGGVAAVAAGKMRPTAWAILVGCLGVVGEYLSKDIFPVSIAISQYRNPAALAVASYTGIWGVTFLLWLVPSLAIAAASGAKK